jgi:hypothetical protein
MENLIFENRTSAAMNDKGLLTQIYMHVLTLRRSLFVKKQNLKYSLQALVWR